MAARQGEPDVATLRTLDGRLSAHPLGCLRGETDRGRHRWRRLLRADDCLEGGTL